VGVGLEIADEMSEAAGRAKNWSLIISKKIIRILQQKLFQTMKMEEIAPRKKKKYDA
jgi:hypothetical protein